MVLRMSRPHSRPGQTTMLAFRKAIPADVRSVAKGTPFVVALPSLGNEPAVTVRAKFGRREVNVSVRTRDPAVAKARVSLCAAQFELLVGQLRSAAPTMLSQRDAAGLSREVYDAFATTWFDNPRTAEQWAANKGLNRAAREGRLPAALLPVLSVQNVSAAVPVVRELFGHDLTAGIDATPPSTTTPVEALEARFGQLADVILAKRGIVNLDTASRVLLLIETERTASHVAAYCKRLASGDWRPDPDADRFPPLPTVLRTATEPTRSQAKGPSWADVVSAWSVRHRQGDGSPRTRADFESRVKRFAAFAKVEPSVVTADHVRRWIDTRLAEGVSARTVGDKDLTTLRAVFNAAVGAGVLPEGFNPARSVQAPRRSAIQRVRQQMRSLSDDDVATILAAAERQADPLRRWVPLLCATTGSRVATMVNLRGCDVVQIDGVWCAYITDEAGPVKTAPSIRHVPLHSSVLAAGFLDFVKSKGDARLFYDDNEPRRMRRVSKRSTTGATAPAASLGDTAYKRLRNWIIGLPGLEVGNDKRKAPLHGFRKWTTTQLVVARIEETLWRAITGHAARDQAALYPDQRLLIKAMKDAVERVALPSLTVPSSAQDRAEDVVAA